MKPSRHLTVTSRRTAPGPASRSTRGVATMKGQPMRGGSANGPVLSLMRSLSSCLVEGAVVRTESVLGEDAAPARVLVRNAPFASMADGEAREGEIVTAIRAEPRARRGLRRDGRPATGRWPGRVCGWVRPRHLGLSDGSGRDPQASGADSARGEPGVRITGPRPPNPWPRSRLPPGSRGAGTTAVAKNERREGDGHPCPCTVHGISTTHATPCP